MKSVLVTGASGFIGVNLCRSLNARGISIYALLRSEGAYGKELRSMSHVVPVFCDLGGVRSLPDIIRGANIDTVYHLAWSGVSGNDRGNYRIQIRNIEYALELVKVAQRLGSQRFIGVGSTAEYDSYNASIIDGMCPNKVSMYGTSKMTAHFMSKTFCNELGMEHIWGIIGNTYGVGDKSNNFVNYAIRLLTSEREAEFTSGEQNYDFVYITDVAEALCCLGEEGRNMYSYYIGSGEPGKLKDYIVSIRNIFNPGKELKLGAVPFNGVSADITSFSIEKIKKDTYFIPQISFEKGIRMIKEWHKSRAELTSGTNSGGGTSKV